MAQLSREAQRNLEARIAEQDAIKAREEADRRATIARNLRLNAEARERRLAVIDREKAERQAREQEAIEAELAPEKAWRQRGWLIDHPGHDPADFERVWPLIREEIVEERRRAQAERDLANVRSRYRF